MKVEISPSDYTYSTFYGLSISLILIFYILSIKNLGYGDMNGFQFLNFVILAIGIFSALKQYKNQNSFNLGVFKLFKIGVMISVITIASFAFFIILYLGVFNTTFMEFLIEKSNSETYLSFVTIVALILIIGLSSALMITFICTQYFMRNSIKKSSY